MYCIHIHTHLVAVCTTQNTKKMNRFTCFASTCIQSMSCEFEVCALTQSDACVFGDKKDSPLSLARSLSRSLSLEPETARHWIGSNVCCDRSNTHFKRTAAHYIQHKSHAVVASQSRGCFRQMARKFKQYMIFPCVTVACTREFHLHLK